MRVIASAVLIASSALGTANAGLVTIEPDVFAAGRDVSSAYDGVRLSTLYRDEESGVIGYSPVYSIEAGECFLINCSATGSRVFGFERVAQQGVASNTHWGHVTSAITYFTTHQLGDAFGLDRVLRVDFDTPTDYVDVLGGFFEQFSVGMGAFDIDGQLLGSCQLDGIPAQQPNDCRKVFDPDLIEDAHGHGWYLTTLTRPTADISFVLIGGLAHHRPLDAIRYNQVPEPSSLGLLSLGLMGLSLASRRLLRWD